MLQIDGKLIYKNVFVKKEIEVASMIQNENLVNGIEVIDDPNHDQIYLIYELCDQEICKFIKSKMIFDNSNFIKQVSTNEKGKSNSVISYSDEPNNNKVEKDDNVSSKLDIDEDMLKNIFKSLLSGLQ